MRLTRNRSRFRWYRRVISAEAWPRCFCTCASSICAEEARPARSEWPPKAQPSFALGQIAANAGGERGFLHQPGDMFVGQPLGRDAAILARDRPKQRPVTDPAEPHPGLEQRDGAGFGTRAAADFDLAPAGLAIDGQQQAASLCWRRLGVAPALGRRARGKSRPSRSRPRSDPGRNRGRRFPNGAGRRRSRCARMARSRRPRRSMSSVANIARSSSAKIASFWSRRAAMGAANAGEHRRNMPIDCIERLAELAVTPANAGEPALQVATETGCDRGVFRAPAELLLHTGGEIEADGLRVRGQGIEALPAQPGGKLPPIGVIGALGVVRAGVAGVVAGLFGERRRDAGRGRARRAADRRLSNSSSMLAIASSFWRRIRALASLSGAKIRRLGRLWAPDFGHFRPEVRGVSNHVR